MKVTKAVPPAAPRPEVAEVMVGASGPGTTSNDLTTAGAAPKVALLASAALKVQVPTPTMCTVIPDTVQTFGVLEVTVGAAPLVALTDNAKSAAVEI